MTGADLAQVVNEAALLAGRANRLAITREDLEQGLARILEAPERQRRLSLRTQSVGRRSSGRDERVTFADIAGADDAVAELAELKDYLTAPERFAQLGVRVPRGIMLAGPPGCGKTMLAKAVAGESNAAFITASGTDFVEIFVGQGAARVRDLFAEARNLAPAIIFIDEIDAVGGRRSSGTVGSGQRESDQTLNQILVELDGFEARTGVIVVGATNRLDMLDPALTRAGRFDRHVTVTLPDRAGREAILRVHARGKPLAMGVDLAAVARMTHGFSGAELANIINEAGLLAGRAKLREISIALFEEAVERVLLGISSRRRILSDAERHAVAYHEAGHAVVSMTMAGLTVPHKVTIVPRGNADGYLWGIDQDEQVVWSRTVLLNQMAGMLGGRAAEEMVLGEPSAGASSDLSRVSELARRMVCEFGMAASLGQQAFGRLDNGVPVYSEDEARQIGVAVRQITDEAHILARRVLSDERALLDCIARALLEHETLSCEQLQRLRSAREPATRSGARV
jgi:cell division protease FtsH